MIPEFDQYPVFYFTNHHSIQGPGDIRCMPDHFEKLDFELEVAIVIARHGRNIRASEADDYIAGLMIMNDMSARTLQDGRNVAEPGSRQKARISPRSTGPWLVTPDELREFEVPCKAGHTGKSWNLRMQCRVNGVRSAMATWPIWTGPLPSSSKGPPMASTCIPAM
jgi:fumarylacetoacetate (FAA) hydrolase